jgi:hypothetical protein
MPLMILVTREIALGEDSKAQSVLYGLHDSNHLPSLTTTALTQMLRNYWWVSVN